jgi:hypothetical protein
VITALVARDLIIASRIAEAAAGASVEFRRFDDPSDLPEPSEIQLLLVDWGNRLPEWGKQLTDWKALALTDGPPRVILFGPHVDLGAHADARAAGLGPMWARSKLIAELPTLLR